MSRFKIKLLSPSRLLNWAKAMFKPHSQRCGSCEAYFKYFCTHLNLFQPMLRRRHLVLMLVMPPQMKCHMPVVECLVAKRRLVAHKPNLTLLEVAEGKGQQFSKRPWADKWLSNLINSNFLYIEKFKKIDSYCPCFFMWLASQMKPYSDHNNDNFLLVKI